MSYCGDHSAKYCAPCSQKAYCDNEKRQWMQAINKTVRLTGIIMSLTYLIVILALWIHANMNGYTYFRGGEPLWYIKYPEWILGAVGIYTLFGYLRQEIKSSNINKS